MNNKGGGLSRCSVGFFLSHSTAKLRGEPFCVSDNFLKGKKTWNRGVCHDFLSKFFSLTVPKDFVGNRCVFQRISALE